jgi:transcriptional regulator with XRE-family HTH domain
MNTIGKRIKAFRKSKKLSGKNLAEIIRISQGSLSDLENDKTTPKSSTIESIIRNTDINPVWLMTGEGEMTAKAPLVQPGMSTEQQQAYPVPTGSIGRLLAKAVEVLESEDKVLVGALSQSIQALHRALKDSRKVRKLPGKGPKPGQEAAGDGAAEET